MGNGDGCFRIVYPVADIECRFGSGTFQLGVVTYADLAGFIHGQLCVCVYGCRKGGYENDSFHDIQVFGVNICDGEYNIIFQIFQIICQIFQIFSTALSFFFLFYRPGGKLGRHGSFLGIVHNRITGEFCSPGEVSDIARLVRHYYQKVNID